MVMKALGIAEKHGWNKFVGMQYFYAVAGRDIEREILPLAVDQNLAVMPWSPLAGGFLSGKFTRNTEKAGDSRRDNFDFPPVNKIKTYDIIDVIAEIGQQKGITSTIIGAKNIDQLNANIKSTEVQLTAENLAKIDEVSALTKEYPGWMVERQATDRVLK
jgi:aryl-alcohol dehydrogenase-like predicted oxidoreductase